MLDRCGVKSRDEEQEGYFVVLLKELIGYLETEKERYE